MDGGIFFVSRTGESSTQITPTKPSLELQQDFAGIIELYSLEDICHPISLVTWCSGVISRYISREASLGVPPDTLLAAARFGEAQLRGASEEVMRIAFEELMTSRFRSHQQWKELVNPGDLICEAVTRDFKNDIIRFTTPDPSGEMFEIREFDLPSQAQSILENIFDQMDLLMSKEMAKINYQAVVRPKDINDLKADERVCSICLMEYEIELGSNRMHEFGVPLYDNMKDNRQPLQLTCGHIFGRTCIEKWLFNNGSCPLCRAILVGKDRIPRQMPQQLLSALAASDNGEMLLYFEDLEWDRSSHEVIREAIGRRNRTAALLLTQQFERLKEIDLRLGTPTRREVDARYSSINVVEWMNDDWLEFGTNLRALLKDVTEYGRSHKGWTPSNSITRMIDGLKVMLKANAIRRLLLLSPPQASPCLPAQSHPSPRSEGQ